MQLPDQMARVDMTGFLNVYVRRFLPPPEVAWAGEDVRAFLRELPEDEQAVNIDRFHVDDPRPAWWWPAGLALDEIRVGPTWDTLLDTWMAKKQVADLAVGSRLASSRGVPFLGVRVLTLGNPRNSALVTRQDGQWCAQPLESIDWLAIPAGVTALHSAAQADELGATGGEEQAAG